MLLNNMTLEELMTFGMFCEHDDNYLCECRIAYLQEHPETLNN